VGILVIQVAVCLVTLDLVVSRVTQAFVVYRDIVVSADLVDTLDTQAKVDIRDTQEVVLAGIVGTQGSQVTQVLAEEAVTAVSVACLAIRASVANRDTQAIRETVSQDILDTLVEE
jgi:hypothetical protein